MTDSIIRLTKSEEKIMKMFWKQNGEPLTSSEVVEASPDRNWKASSVHLLLNSLLNKGVIEVRGFKRTAKNYARTFQPSLSKIESTYIILSQKKRTHTHSGMSPLKESDSFLYLFNLQSFENLHINLLHLLRNFHYHLSADTLKRSLTSRFLRQQHRLDSYCL